MWDGMDPSPVRTTSRGRVQTRRNGAQSTARVSRLVVTCLVCVSCRGGSASSRRRPPWSPRSSAVASAPTPPRCQTRASWRRATAARLRGQSADTFGSLGERAREAAPHTRNRLQFQALCGTQFSTFFFLLFSSSAVDVSRVQVVCGPRPKERRTSPKRRRTPETASHCKRPATLDPGVSQPDF